jgi:adenosylhomocysteine nucleosidase
MLNILTALNCEAQPIISHYRLKMRNNRLPFQIYENEEIRLIISGVGKVSSASATGYLYGLSDSSEHHVWLNVGVSGHRKQNIGEAFLINKITDMGTKKSYYPTFVFKHPFTSLSLETHDKSVSDYPSVAAVDMEASGFYEAACRFSTTEFIHSYKIISDNEDSPLIKLDKAFAEKLIQKRLEEIVLLIEKLAELSREEEILLQDPETFPLFLSQWHFSTSESFRLLSVLKRLLICVPENQQMDEELRFQKRGKDVLRILEKRLESLPVQLT